MILATGRYVTDIVECLLPFYDIFILILMCFLIIVFMLNNYYFVACHWILHSLGLLIWS